MSKILVHAEIDSQNFLASFSKMQVQELEYFAQAINELIAQKRAKQQQKEITSLLQAINETALSNEKWLLIWSCEQS